MEQEGIEVNVNLGKRKQREEENDQRSSGSTLFVSNLPYTATSIDLQTLFSDLGPVRSAFVVLEQNISKGVGYVSFAIKEDAEKALDLSEKEAINLDGRRLRLQWAQRKPKEESEKVSKAGVKKTNVPKPSFSKPPKDPDAIRTVIISGFPSGIDQKVLWKKIRKCEGAENVTLIDEGNCVAHATFASPAAASQAVDKLHAHVFKGSILSATLKKRLDGLAKSHLVDKNDRNSKSINVPSRGSRLIIRNLPWDITEQDLRALFLPYGPIYMINIPINQGSDDGKQRARGFAFVWFFSKKDAESAIDGVNGRSVSAGSILAPTMNKKEKARLRKKLREQQKADEDGENKGEDDDLEVISEVKKLEPRVLAVDWALSKDRWEEAKAKGLVEQASGNEEGQEGSSEGDMSASEHDGEQSDENSEGWVDEEESNMDTDEDRSDEDQAHKPVLPQTDIGTTLFVRNVPYDATEDELRTLFRAFGTLRYVRITMDPITARSRGTAFACFWKREDADKAIRQSELLNREAGADTATKKNPFSMPSILTPDPSSSLAQSLVIHGRTLDVTRAVPRDEAQKLKDDGERQRERADKRNLYLLREGVIFPNTPAATSLPSAELEKRTASFNTRRSLLKSNPSLFVSKTRLSIRQLPIFVTDKILKKMAIYAVRTFEEEVKKGQRQPLSEDELRSVVDSESNGISDDNRGSSNKKRHIRKDRDTKVKQAKIIRQTDKVDALTGGSKSKGYGFLEMNAHSDALRVLRWANNNPAVGDVFVQWWKTEVEETIEKLKASRKNLKKEEMESVESRLKRFQVELERLTSGDGLKFKKALIIEFSIENAQVINRRKERTEMAKQTSKLPRKRINEEDDKSEAERPIKKPKIDRSISRQKDSILKSKGDVTNDHPGKTGKTMGSLIGRKRKTKKIAKARK